METKEYSIGKIIKILFIILIIIVVFYAITILITKYQDSKPDKTTQTDIKYEEILIGNMYKKNEDVYYVLAQFENDLSKLYSAVYNYQQEGEIKLYTATLDNALNKKYIGEESNFSEKYPIFKESTLLKIQNGEIVEYVEGVDKILGKIS